MINIILNYNVNCASFKREEESKFSYGNVQEQKRFASYPNDFSNQDLNNNNSQNFTPGLLDKVRESRARTIKSLIAFGLPFLFMLTFGTSLGWVFVLRKLPLSALIPILITGMISCFILQFFLFGDSVVALCDNIKNRINNSGDGSKNWQYQLGKCIATPLFLSFFLGAGFASLRLNKKHILKLLYIFTFSSILFTLAVLLLDFAKFEEGFNVQTVCTLILIGIVSSTVSYTMSKLLCKEKILNLSFKDYLKKLLLKFVSLQFAIMLFTFALDYIFGKICNSIISNPNIDKKQKALILIFLISLYIITTFQVLIFLNGFGLMNDVKDFMNKIKKEDFTQDKLGSIFIGFICLCMPQVFLFSAFNLFNSSKQLTESFLTDRDNSVNNFTTLMYLVLNQILASLISIIEFILKIIFEILKKAN